MFEGMKIIYRVSLAILHLSRKELLKKSNGLGELMMYLKNLPDEILVPDVLMPAALNISIKVSIRLSVLPPSSFKITGLLYLILTFLCVCYLL